jgi:hypothetical protein
MGSRCNESLDYLGLGLTVRFARYFCMQWAAPYQGELVPAVLPVMERATRKCSWSIGRVLVVPGFQVLIWALLGFTLE